MSIHPPPIPEVTAPIDLLTPNTALQTCAILIRKVKRHSNPDRCLIYCYIFEHEIMLSPEECVRQLNEARFDAYLEHGGELYPDLEVTP